MVAPATEDSSKDKKAAQPTAAAAVKSKADIRKITLQKSEGRCVYKDPVTGHICGSRYLLEIDHIHPRALGGSDEPHNLRTLCRQHNLLMAEKSFGVEMMDRFRRT